MNNKDNIIRVQKKILEIMIFIDDVCRKNDIKYFIMGGTALGAVRHGGFIPWDDDLDIFMTPENYSKFYNAFNLLNNDKFVLQEWKIVNDYVEYSKLRMNGTTFIEKIYKDKKGMHHGIYVDIMILHKCPNINLVKRAIYIASKYVTLLALSKRNWEPKNRTQKLSLILLKLIPNKLFATLAYKLIYRYDNLRENYCYCYFITKANFKQGIFAAHIFDEIKDVKFENSILMAPKNIKDYLEIRYGDYMKLPSEEEIESSIHAEIYDTDVGFENYL